MNHLDSCNFKESLNYNAIGFKETIKREKKEALEEQGK